MTNHQTVGRTSVDRPLIVNLAGICSVMVIIECMI